MNALANIQTERQVQRGILKMLRECFPAVFYAAIPNGAHLAGDGAARSRQMGALLGDGLKKGMPDLICLWAIGKGAFLEVKRPKGGVLSDVQGDVHEALGALGWPVSVVTSADEAWAFLRDCGAPCVGELQ